MGRYVDFDQSIALGLQPVDLGLVFSSESKAVGLGISLERDSRDMPTNPYNGSLFKVSGLFNDESFGSDSTYESYNVAYNSYHKLTAPVVLAWQVKACQKTGTPPLWDACRVGLRGFSAMDYMGKESALAQVEARWQMSKRWGAVVFAGAGYMNDSVSGIRDQEAIPSYGAGIRFMVMTAKRINLRIDYGRSKDSSAWYLSAGEAF
jgi:outer membrane protein assembly factor BamA